MRGGYLMRRSYDDHCLQKLISIIMGVIIQLKIDRIKIRLLGESIMKVEKDFSIKQLILEEGFVVILDTNILLNVYRYSPDFSEFALNCLTTIKDYIFLPSIVRLEYGKHCRGDYARMSNRIGNAKTNIQREIDSSRIKILNSLNNLRKLQFPDIDNLRDDFDKKINELTEIKEAFFDDRSVVDFASHAWESDLLMKLVEYIDSKNHVFKELTVQEIYEWDEQGEKRYRNNIPPGYMDSKNKNGVRQYSDFFIWKEILRFAQEYKRDIIFVTDDTKQDWWFSEGEQLVFRTELYNEFKKSGCRIVPLTSEKFYSEISSSYSIDKVDNVELALNMSDADYCTMVADSVFDSIIDDLYYRGIDYINEDSAHIGTEGIGEFEVVEYEFVKGKRVDRAGSAFTYQFEYNITAEGVSYDYWGRDDDTHEIIKSFGREHVFEGSILVNVERKADIFIDVEDTEFESATIVYGDLIEIDYTDLGASDIAF